MGFGTLAVICVAGLAGPLLALPQRARLPVVLGELLAGIVLGPTVAGSLHASDPTFTFLADLGFALVMFVAGTHVPIRDPQLRRGIRPGVSRAVAIGVLSAGLGWGISALFGTGHAGLYAVVLASSSAALILPVVDSLHLSGRPVLQLLPQVALADATCIVALPLAIEPAHAARAALGALAVAASAVVLFLVLRFFERSGRRRRLHKLSQARGFALELRINLVILFALGALATHTHVSIMLAGFAFGLAVAAIGEPRRLARQLFALTEGFLGPLFFVWLGASLNLRELGSRPSMILLGVALGAGAVLTHGLMRLLNQPVPIGVLASAQLGVPVAAATLGTQLHLLGPGEAPALLLGALLTIAAATLAGSVAARTLAAPPPSPPAQSGPSPAEPAAGSSGAAAVVAAAGAET